MSETDANPAKPAKLSRHAIRIALWALPLAALGNIIFFLWAMDGQPISSIAERPWLLALAAGLAVVPWFTNVVRLAIWCRFLGVELHLKQNIRVILGTVIANSVTPTATGGTVIKWGFLCNEGVSADKAGTLVSTQIAEDTIVMLSLLAIALFFAFGFELPSTLRELDWVGARASTAQALLFLVALILTLGILFGMARRGLFGSRVAGIARRLGARTAELCRNVASDWKTVLKGGKSVVMTSMALSVVQWGARYSVATAIIGFAGGAMLPLLYWALQWLTFTFSTIVPTPGGIGGSEAAFLLLYAPFLSPDTLAQVMVIWRLMLFYVPTGLAAVIFLGMRGRVSARPV
ncbi:MAG: lysylphosphatidylglycerol synthase transmembrane domain-containing protein [Pseudomonadota bacterium]